MLISSRKVGAPGLDFETGDTKILNKRIHAGTEIEREGNP
jgi:hypothetical protein